MCWRCGIPVGEMKKADDLSIVRLESFGCAAARLYRCFDRSARAVSAPLVDLPAVADKVQIDPALGEIVFIEHTVIAHAKLAFRAAGQALVGKRIQPDSHLVHLGLHGGAD